MLACDTQLDWWSSSMVCMRYGPFFVQMRMTTGRALVSQNKCSLCIFFVFVAHALDSGNM